MLLNKDTLRQMLQKGHFEGIKLVRNITCEFFIGKVFVNFCSLLEGVAVLVTQLVVGLDFVLANLLNLFMEHLCVALQVVCWSCMLSE